MFGGVKFNLAWGCYKSFYGGKLLESRSILLRNINEGYMVGMVGRIQVLILEISQGVPRGDHTWSKSVAGGAVALVSSETNSG